MAGDAVRQTDQPQNPGQGGGQSNAENEVDEFRRSQKSLIPKTNGNGTGTSAERSQTPATGPVGSERAGTGSPFSPNGNGQAGDRSPFAPDQSREASSEQNGVEKPNNGSGLRDTVSPHNRSDSRDNGNRHDRSGNGESNNGHNESRVIRRASYVQDGDGGQQGRRDDRQSRGIQRGDGLRAKEIAEKREAEAKTRLPLDLEPSMARADNIYGQIYRGRGLWGTAIMQTKLLGKNDHLDPKTDPKADPKIDPKDRVDHLDEKDLGILRKNIEAINKGDFKTYIEPSLRASVVMSSLLKEKNIDTFTTTPEGDKEYTEVFIAPKGSNEALKISFYGKGDPTHETHLHAVTIKDNPDRADIEIMKEFGLDQKITDETQPISAKPEDVDQRINSILSKMADRDIKVADLRAAAAKSKSSATTSTLPEAVAVEAVTTSTAILSLEAGVTKPTRPAETPAGPKESRIMNLDLIQPTDVNHDSDLQQARLNKLVTEFSLNLAGDDKFKSPAFQAQLERYIEDAPDGTAALEDLNKGIKEATTGEKPEPSAKIIPGEKSATQQELLVYNPGGNIVGITLVSKSALDGTKPATTASINSNLAKVEGVKNPETIAAKPNAATPADTGKQNDVAVANTATPCGSDTVESGVKSAAVDAKPTPDRPSSPVSPTVTASRDSTPPPSVVPPITRPAQPVPTPRTEQPTTPTTANRDTAAPTSTPGNNGAIDQSTVAAKDTASRPTSPTSRPVDSAPSRPRLSDAEINNILTNDDKYKNKYKDNLQYGKDSNGNDLKGADAEAYVKALIYLHTGNLEGMKQFAAGGAHPLPDNTAMALDDMFQANGLLPYPPSEKNPGVTVMTLYNKSNEGKLITSSEGIRTTNLPGGTTKLEYVTVEHQKKEGTTADIKRAKGLYNPVKNASESKADILRVGNEIQKRISGRTVAETEADFGSYATKPASAIASKDIAPPTTVGQPNNGAQAAVARDAAGQPNNGAKPAVAARGNAEKPQSPPSRPADSADSRPQMSTNELLQRDRKFQQNLAFGNHLRGYDQATYVKALVCLTTGDLDGMNEFSAGGKFPMSNRTARALDNMFKSNGLLPYMPGGKNSGVTVMALNDRSLQSEGIRTTTLRNGKTKVEHVDLQHAQGPFGRGLIADYKRGLKGYNPVTRASDDMKQIKRVGDIIQKRLSGRTLVETLTHYDSSSSTPDTTIAGRDTVGTQPGIPPRPPTPLAGARAVLGRQNQPATPDRPPNQPTGITERPPTAPPAPPLTRTRSADASAPARADAKDKVAKLPAAPTTSEGGNIFGAPVKTDKDKDVTELNHTNGTKIDNTKYLDTKHNGHKLLVSFDETKNGNKITWKRGEEGRFFGTDSHGKKVGAYDDIELHANGNVIYKDVQRGNLRGDLVVRGDGHELPIGPKYEFDQLGRFTKITSDKIREYKYNGDSLEPTQIKVQNPIVYPGLTFTHELQANQKDWACKDNLNRSWSAPQGVHHLDQSTGTYTFEDYVGQPNHPTRVFHASHADGKIEFKQLAFHENDGKVDVRNYNGWGAPVAQQTIDRQDKSVSGLIQAWDKSHSIIRNTPINRNGQTDQPPQARPPRPPQNRNSTRPPIEPAPPAPPVPQVRPRGLNKGPNGASDRQPQRPTPPTKSPGESTPPAERTIKPNDSTSPTGKREPRNDTHWLERATPEKIARASTETNLAKAFTKKLNETRKAYGIQQEVGFDEETTYWAAENTDQQCARGIGHYVLNGTLRQNSAWGPVIGSGPGQDGRTVDALHDMWMSSAPHKSAMLDPRVNRIGISQRRVGQDLASQISGEPIKNGIYYTTLNLRQVKLEDESTALNQPSSPSTTVSSRPNQANLSPANRPGTDSRVVSNQPAQALQRPPARTQDLALSSPPSAPPEAQRPKSLPESNNGTKSTERTYSGMLSAERVSPGFEAKVEAILNTFDNEVIQYFKDREIKIASKDLVSEQQGFVKGSYHHEQKTLYLAETQYRGSQLVSCEPWIGNTVPHELSHVIDYNNETGLLSNEDRFKNTFSAELSRLSPMDRERFKHLDANQNPLGNQEAWAYLVNAHRNQNTIWPAEEMKAKFSGSMQVIADQMNEKKLSSFLDGSDRSQQNRVASATTVPVRQVPSPAERPNDLSPKSATTQVNPKTALPPDYTILLAGEPKSLAGKGNPKLGGAATLMSTDEDGNRYLKYPNDTWVVMGPGGKAGRVVGPVNPETGYRHMEGFGPKPENRFSVDMKPTPQGGLEYKFFDGRPDIVVNPAPKPNEMPLAPTKQMPSVGPTKPLDQLRLAKAARAEGRTLEGTGDMESTSPEVAAARAELKETLQAQKLYSTRVEEILNKLERRCYEDDGLTVPSAENLADAYKTAAAILNNPGIGIFTDKDLKDKTVLEGLRNLSDIEGIDQGHSYLGFCGETCADKYIAQRDARVYMTALQQVIQTGSAKVGDQSFEPAHFNPSDEETHWSIDNEGGHYIVGNYKYPQDGARNMASMVIQNLCMAYAYQENGRTDLRGINHINIENFTGAMTGTPMLTVAMTGQDNSPNKIHAWIDDSIARDAKAKGRLPLLLYPGTQQYHWTTVNNVGESTVHPGRAKVLWDNQWGKAKDPGWSLTEWIQTHPVDPY